MLTSCGGGTMSENTYLGKLPSMALDYQDQLDGLKAKGEKATSVDEAFKISKEIELKEKEAEQAIKEYFEAGTLKTPLKFEENPVEKFTVKSIKITGATLSNLRIEAAISLKEDLKNEYGNYEKFVFGYINVLDTEGAKIGETVVLASNSSGNPEFKAGAEIILVGSMRYLKDFVNLETLQFISKEQYDKGK